MKQIPVTNDTESNMHVGGSVLRPGETQLVEPHLVPPGYGAVSTQANDEPPADPVLALQKSKGDIVIAELTALSLDDLHTLEALEASAKKPRAGVLAAITAEHLRRASEKKPGDEGGEQKPDGEGGE